MKHLSASDAAMVLAITGPGVPEVVVGGTRRRLSKREISKAQRLIWHHQNQAARRATHAQNRRRIESLAV